MWFVFFFKQKTAYEMRISDWSSDVCSSDLIPSLDPVLMRVKFDEAQVMIDGDFLGLDKIEELSIKSIITRDVYPIITKAFPVQLIEKKSRSLSDFINGLWKAQSAEAEMFIEAFGIEKALANRILTAWRSAEHTSELQSLMRISYAVFIL